LPLPVRAALPALLQRKFVYTGITRGKKLVVLIGQRKYLFSALRRP
jgi:ATP-dependent exoDNAse (exonuclease V) alpha subunit